MPTSRLLACVLLALLTFGLTGCQVDGPGDGANFALTRSGPGEVGAALVMQGARHGDLKLAHLGEGGEGAPEVGTRLLLRGVETVDGDPLLVTWAADGVELGPAVVSDAVSIEVDGSGAALGGAQARIVAGWMSILPPLVAIVFAILARQVLVALLLGAATGAMVLHGSLVGGFLRTIDTHVIGALADEDHLKILLFSSMLGAVVALVARMGGMRVVVDGLVRRSKSRRGVQGGTWFMGILVFFDDYANALLVGNTVRPASDRYRISREKLAYLVDATSAPVACIAIVSTWIVAEVGYIGDWLDDKVANGESVAGYTDAYTVFLDSIPYNFYPLLALAFGLMIVVTRRDFGPMYRAERRAITTGQLLRPGAVPLAGEELKAAEEEAPEKARWWNGVVPILTIVIAVVIGLYQSGIGSVANPETMGFFERLRTAYGEANSYDVLIMASLLGLVVAWGLGLSQRVLTLDQAAETSVRGIKAMLVAMLVLTFAWTLSDLCKLLDTSGWLIQSVSLSFEGLPAVTFLLAAVVGFSTGSSWGTMAILVPLTLAYAHQAGLEVGADQAQLQAVLLGSLGAVLAGAVFGDHCSPISDTTVMSSMAAGSDHIDHVKTQLPYAMAVGVVALLVGYLPAGFGFPPWGSLLGGVAILLGLILILGRNPEDAQAS